MIQRSEMTITGWGVSDTDIALLRQGLPECAIMSGTLSRRHVLVFSGVERGNFAALLARDLDFYVEWAGVEETTKILATAQGDLRLSTTTRTAFQVVNGAAIAGLMARRGLIEAVKIADVGGAIQEAVANAVMHGNLAMRRSDTADEEDFITFHRTVRQRIDGPEGLSHRVTIDVEDHSAEVVVRIADQGSGFDPADVVATDFGSSGRGLGIMKSRARQLHHENGGRVAVLTFQSARELVPLPPTG